MDAIQIDHLPITEKDNRTIFRKAHNRENPYAQISKALLKDRRVSAKGKGIMCYLLGLPDNWEINISELSSNFSDGEKSIKSGIRELISLGYIEKRQDRTPHGYFGRTVMLVYEEPIKTPQPLQKRVRRSPLAQKRPAVKRPAENGTLINTEYTKTEELLKNNNKQPSHRCPETQGIEQAPKPQIEPASSVVVDFEVDDLMNLTQGWAVSRVLMDTWAKKHGVSYVLQKIELTKSAIALNQVKKPGAYLNKAISFDWLPPAPAEEEGEKASNSLVATVYPSHEENVAWYASLAKNEKLAVLDEAIFRRPLFKDQLEQQNLSVLDAFFTGTPWFKVLMGNVGRAV